MRLGLVTYNLARTWDVETIIKNCAECRFEGVELRTTHAHRVEVSLSKDERAEVKKRFLDSPVDLVSLGSAFEFHSPDPAEVRKNVEGGKEYLVLAHDVGAEAIKVRPNGFPRGEEPERTLERIGKSLRELGEHGANYGIKVRLEVHGTGTSLLSNVARILAAADHRQVEVTWNSNQSDLEGGTLEENFERVKSKGGMVHLRDLFIEDYPWRKLFALLKASGFQGFACAEIPESADPLRVMRYFRALFLSYQSA